MIMAIALQTSSNDGSSSTNQIMQIDKHNQVVNKTKFGHNS
jgi:hypothetical protein